MNPMILLNDLTFTYAGNDTSVLSNIDLQVNEGETVLIGGDSGSGKSTLLHCLNGLIPHVYQGEATGSILVDGRSPAEIPLSGLSAKIGTVFQNVDNQLFMLKVGDDVAFGCENLSMNSDDIHARVDYALNAMGIAHLRDMDISTLSGGEKQRTAIAGILAMGPKIILFDEPLAEQDENGRIAFRSVLKRLRHSGYTCVIIEHRIGEIVDCVDRMMTMVNGRLYDDTYKPPPRVIPLDCPVAPAGHTCEKKTESAIRIENISYKYDGGSWVIDNLDIDIKKGDFVAITGSNGSGKSTLFKLLSGFLRPEKGSICINGILKPSLNDLIGGLGYLYQNPDEQLFTASVEEEILFGPIQMGMETQVDEYLTITGLEHHSGRHPFTLSRGERQRLAIGAILSMRPEIIILDEPTTGLDRNNWIRIMDVMKELNRRGTTIVFSSHNKDVISLYARNIICLGGGN